MRFSLPQWSAGLWCLQISAFLTGFGFFMLIPLLAVHFTHDLGISLTMTGILYAVRLFAQQGLMLFGGMIADRIGYKETIILGSVVRTIGFGMLGFASSLPALFVACTLAGAGGALFGPAWQAATTELSTPQNREQVFAWRNIFSNSGFTLGPMAGAWLSGLNVFNWTCYFAASVFLIFGFLVWLWVPKIQTVKRKKMNLLQDIVHLSENRTFFWVSFWLMGFYMLVQQLYMVIPVLAKEQVGYDISGILFTIMSLLVIFFQHPVTRLIERFQIQPLPVMVLGMFILGISFIPAALNLSAITVILPIIGIAFSSMFIQPTSQTWIADIAEKELLASYYGFSSLLSIAIGGTIGSTGGGWIVEKAFAAGHTALPFVLFGAVGIGCGAAIFQLNRLHKRSMGKRGSNLHVE